MTGGNVGTRAIAARPLNIDCMVGYVESLGTSEASAADEMERG